MGKNEREMQGGHGPLQAFDFMMVLTLNPLTGKETREGKGGRSKKFMVFSPDKEQL